MARLPISWYSRKRSYGGGDTQERASVTVSPLRLERYMARLVTLEDATENDVVRYLEMFSSFEAAAQDLEQAILAVMNTSADAFATSQVAWILELERATGYRTAYELSLLESATYEIMAQSNFKALPPAVAARMEEFRPKYLAAFDEEDAAAGAREARRTAAKAAARRVGRAAAAEAKRRGSEILTEAVARADATAQQLGRDPWGLLVAWIPGDAHPCGFCTLLASNGWRMARKGTLQAYKDHIHEGCRCQQIFRPENVAIGGYSPKKWAGLVDDVRAEARKPSGEIDWAEAARAIDRKNYAIPDVGDEIRARHRADYARRKEAGEDTD